MKFISSFFDSRYQTPAWFQEKQSRKQQLSRRGFLKSAAGAGAVAALPAITFSAQAIEQLAELRKTDPWLTLDATLAHLLPSSKTGPSASDIKALEYLYQVMTVQPTAQAEKDFIVKGVGWLNGFANSEKGQGFVALSTEDKEIILTKISQSRAGENWLSTLLSYIFEAMLAPPAYGGNPDGIGWQWLEHQAGFPLPKAGQRYFELPPRARTRNEIAIHTVAVTAPMQVNQAKNVVKKSIKRVHKA